jgi:hydrogenase-4 component B
VLVGCLLGLRAAFGPRAGANHVTWGCGYGLPNVRMQYTGAGFAVDFNERFRSILVLLRRQKAPVGYFPTDSYVATSCVDAVERRLYSVIGHGDASASRLSERLREDDPRVAFAGALIALGVIAGLILLSSGPLS